MSGRDATSGGRAGRGYGDRGGRGRGRGYGYTSAKSTTNNGLCAALGTHIFDYGHKAAADQMQTTWEKLAHYCGTINGQVRADTLSCQMKQECAYTPKKDRYNCQLAGKTIVEETRIVPLTGTGVSFEKRNRCRERCDDRLQEQCGQDRGTT